jgi:predicted DNA-binding antitoxin AbrB/MazE fold protein
VAQATDGSGARARARCSEVPFAKPGWPTSEPRRRCHNDRTRKNKSSTYGRAANLTLIERIRYTQTMSSFDAAETGLMNQIIHATFENGVLKPDVPLEFPPRTRVRLNVETLTGPESAPATESSDPWNELDRIWDEVEIDFGALRPSRDQLYDRH